MSKNFSYHEALAFGWQVTKKNFGFLLGVMVIAFIVAGIPLGLSNYFQEKQGLLSFIFGLIYGIAYLVLSLGIVRITLMYCRGQKPELKHLYENFHLVIRLFLASILYNFIVLAGLILLIVPGIIWAIKYQYYIYLIVDKNLKPLEAIKQSGQVTKGAKADLFFFGIVLGLVNIAGLIALLVGALFTWPMTMIASAYVYLKLLEQTENLGTKATPTPEALPAK